MTPIRIETTHHLLDASTAIRRNPKVASHSNELVEIERELIARGFSETHLEKRAAVNDKGHAIHGLTFLEDTIEIMLERADDIRFQFIEEVMRLLASGAVDAEEHNRGMIFGVALENIADRFLRIRPGTPERRAYLKLKKF